MLAQGNSGAAYSNRIVGARFLRRDLGFVWVEFLWLISLLPIATAQIFAACANQLFESH